MHEFSYIVSGLILYWLPFMWLILVLAGIGLLVFGLNLKGEASRDIAYTSATTTNGRSCNFDLIGTVVVTHDDVRFRSKPNLFGAVLGKWRSGQELSWFGMSGDDQWCLVWDVEGYKNYVVEPVGWTHKKYLGIITEV